VKNLLWVMLDLFLIEFVLASAVYLVARWSGLRPRPGQILLVLAPVALPFIAAVWSQVFSVDVDLNSPSGTDRPDWVVAMFSYLFYASIIAGVAVPALAKGYRAPAAVFALLQIPLTFAIWLLGAMAVTGTYL
jgi:hypothetical protein